MKQQCLNLGNSMSLASARTHAAHSLSRTRTLHVHNLQYSLTSSRVKTDTSQITQIGLLKITGEQRGSRLSHFTGMSPLSGSRVVLLDRLSPQDFYVVVLPAKPDTTPELCCWC